MPETTPTPAAVIERATALWLPTTTCPDCRGYGTVAARILVAGRSGSDVGAETDAPCAACGGSGRVVDPLDPLVDVEHDGDPAEILAAVLHVAAAVRELQRQHYAGGPSWARLIHRAQRAATELATLPGWRGIPYPQRLAILRGAT